MDKSIRLKEKIKSVAIVSIIGIIVGSIFAIIAFGFDLSLIHI